MVIATLAALLIAGPAPRQTLQVPDALKHDGYTYFGLSNDTVGNFELKASAQDVKPGTVTNVIDKVAADKAFYRIVRTGALADDLGDDSIVVEPTGVYMVGTSLGKIVPAKSLMLPAKLAPGTKWTTHSKITRKDGDSLTEDSTYTVKGFEKITTKVGTYDALMVVSTGTSTVSFGATTLKGTFETKTFYVKNRGQVKNSITVTLQNQPPVSVTIEETK